EEFAAALGSLQTTRLRQLFLSRELEEMGLRMMAEPAEAEALELDEDPQAPLDQQRLIQALEQQALLPLLADPERWQQAEVGVTRLPWRRRPGDAPSS
ncbi:MAG: protein phosphatase, partial [Synechococcaceae cyanobacterium]